MYCRIEDLGFCILGRCSLLWALCMHHYEAGDVKGKRRRRRRSTFMEVVSECSHGATDDAGVVKLLFVNIVVSYFIQRLHNSQSAWSGLRRYVDPCS